MAAAFAAAPGAAFAEWTNTYAVEWNEPALYYGGEGNSVDPGTDCPKGANPDPDWVEIMVKADYSREQAEWLFYPDNMMPRSQVLNQMGFRGRDRANVYADPTSTPDPGFVEVSGTIGEGIDLDGDKTTGFTSPEGETGIDNQFYRALGCWKYYRGKPRTSASAMGVNGFMRDGVWAMVIVVSGAGDDPMNDDDVDIGFYMSLERLVKNGFDQVAPDYTFRIGPHERYEAIFKGKVVDGRITTKATPEVFFRDAGYGGGMELLQARADLHMQPDGSLKGYIGGYRPWAMVFDNFIKRSGGVVETQDGIQLPALWYALRRNADYSPAGAGGEKTHISYAQRIDAVPAYVTGPDGKTLVSSVKSYKSVAPKGEPLIYFPPRNRPGRRPVVDGMTVPEGQTEATPLSDKELRPPPSMRAEAAGTKGSVQ
ncbi:MAG: hypothetical protein AB7P23_04085 [Amphiplicatus sp.]